MYTFFKLLNMYTAYTVNIRIYLILRGVRTKFKVINSNLDRFNGGADRT